MLAELPLSSGHQGTYETVSQIRRLVQEGRVDPLIRRTAVRVVRQAGAAPRDTLAEAEALFEFVRNRLVFTRDPVGVEQLTTARGLLLDHDDADCDEYTTLLCSLATSIGIPARLKVVRKGTSGPWRHIYSELAISGQWTPADPTHPVNPLGWEVNHGDARVIPIDAPFAANDLGIIGELVGGIISAIASKKQADIQSDAMKDQAKAAKAVAKANVEATKAANDAAVLAAKTEADAKAAAAADVARAEAEAAKKRIASESAKVLGIDWSKLPQWAPYAAAGVGALVLVRLLR